MPKKILVNLDARPSLVPTISKNFLQDQETVKASKIRWYILVLYVFYTTISCFQWVEYSILTNIVMRYYDVKLSLVDWTGVMFMIVWPLFVFPSSFMIDKWGLRFAALTGCLLTTVGTAVKVFSINRNAFHVVLTGQAIVSLSQVFILSLPPKLATTWFKPNEMSTVCSIGMFGMQLGSALGFLIPPIIVKDAPDLDEVGRGLKVLSWALTFAVIPAFLAVLIYFPREPKYPPSFALADARANVEKVTLRTYLLELKELMTNVGFLIHMLVYSISYGIFSAFGTLLNQTILSFFPGAVEDAGRMGLIMIMIGMCGGFLVGLVLDRTHKYKESNIVIYFGTSCSLTALLLSLRFKEMTSSYLTIAIFGFFLNAYIPAGIEFALELTYPVNESTTTGLLTAASQVLGVLFTLGLSHINEKMGTLWSLIIQISLLFVGTILSMLVPSRLKRQQAYSGASGTSVGFTELPQR
ncbi:uncharacterized MFS-type transporter C09D4.1-like [Euwallacea fornicatus]|uniref:uncharacterized MFS-type transporter C09D4.1-like n=1 Tax=Euwallacea fornicatus TaxID=995702 RepID=UPI00338D7C19